MEPLVGGDQFTVDEVGEFIHFGFCFQFETIRSVILCVGKRWTTALFRRAPPQRSIDDYRRGGFTGVVPDFLVAQ